MVAIKLAAIGLLMIGGTALSRTWQDKPGGATTQPEQQQPAQEQESAPADPPDADGGQATSGAEADSVDGDSAAGPEAPYWLLGRWCLRYQYYVMIRDRHSAAMMPDGTRHRYVLHPDGSFMNLQVVGIPPPAGDGRDEWLGRFDPAAGESSFRSFRDQPIGAMRVRSARQLKPVRNAALEDLRQPGGRMTRIITAAALLGLIGAASFSGATATQAAGFIPPPPVPVAFPYQVMQPGDYQVFVMPWRPESAPHCLAIRSAAGWARAFHPAPVMRGNRPFAPPPGFWHDHIVLLIARAMPMADVDEAIRVDGVDEIAGRLQIQLAFHIADSSATMNAWKGIVIGRPGWLGTVSFRVGTETICTLETSVAGG